MAALKIYPVADGPQPVTQMEGTSRLDAGKDPRALH